MSADRDFDKFHKRFRHLDRNDARIAWEAGVEEGRRRASAPPVILPAPTGWKLVPIEPTEDMAFATTHVNNSLERDDVLAMLRAAIAAAPALQEGSEQPPEYAFTKAKLDQIATTLAESGARLAELQAKYPSEQPPEHQQEGQPAALRASEPLTWESTTICYIKFVTDSQYRKFSAAVQKWYRPICQKCGPSQIKREPRGPVRDWAEAPTPLPAAPVEQTTSTDTNNEKGQA